MAHVSNPRISIIMPVRNRYQLTKQAIDSLISTTSFVGVEFIIVDDASDDQQTIDYLDLVVAHKGALPIRVIRMAAQTHHGACCNAGVAASSGKYLYFSDNDVCFTRGWLDSLSKASELFPEFGIIGGDRHPHHGSNELHSKEGINVEESDTQVGYSMFIKRDLFQLCGPFRHDSLTTYGGDDSLLSENVLRSGLKVGSITPRVVFHCGLTNSMGLPGAGADMFSTQGGPEGIIKL